MSRRNHRHPALEIAVFAAALLLAAFIGRELWRRRAPSSAAPERTRIQPVALNPTRPPLPPGVRPKRTETAVIGVPAIKLTRVQRHKPKAEVVPPPK